jgi:hypothetical protein
MRTAPAARRVARALAVAVLLLWAPAVAGAQSEEAGRYLAFEAYAQLLVSNREAAADSLVAWCEKQGGYFVERSLEFLVLRIPRAAFDGLRPVAEETAERIVSYNPQARDLRQDILATRAAIRSREENLERVVSFLEDADVEGTLALEQEIASLMEEIESYRGRLRALETDIALARAEIALSARAAEIPDTLPSSFDWLNELGVYRFIGEAGP